MATVDSTSTGRHIPWIPPLAYAVIGWLAIVFGFICITIQLQTTEANLLRLTAMDAFQPDLWVLLQPWNLIFSAMSFTERMADITAWIVEIATGIFIVGYSDALDVSGSSGWVMQKFWFVASWALFCFNFASDYKYGNIPGATNENLGHFEFALGMSAAVCFFPIIGLHLVRKGHALSKNRA